MDSDKSAAQKLGDHAAYLSLKSHYKFMTEPNSMYQVVGVPLTQSPHRKVFDSDLILVLLSLWKRGCESWQWVTLPVFDLNISLDSVCPTRSYCRRLIDSLGHSTDATGPFLHVNMISLLVYASKIQETGIRKQMKTLHNLGITLWTHFVLLTASKSERAGMTIHGEVHQSHWTICSDCQSDREKMQKRVRKF